MKKVFVLAALSLLLFTLASAFAEPFLTCDPQDYATAYRIRFSADNGVTWGPWSEGPAVYGAMRFDLADVPVGLYRGEAQAGQATQVADLTTGVITESLYWSDSAPFSLKVPGQRTAPAKIKITAK